MAHGRPCLLCAPLLQVRRQLPALPGPLNRPNAKIRPGGIIGEHRVNHAIPRYANGPHKYAANNTAHIPLFPFLRATDSPISRVSGSRKSRNHATCQSSNSHFWPRLKPVGTVILSSAQSWRISTVGTGRSRRRIFARLDIESTRGVRWWAAPPLQSRFRH